MRDRINNLKGYQKFFLIAAAVMALGFSVLYIITIRREGYAYNGSLLVLSREGENRIYSGDLEQRRAVFTVMPDKTLSFQYGEKTYGPYTFKEDSSAVPKVWKNDDTVSGVELYLEGKLIFRGGIRVHHTASGHGEIWAVYNEDGSYFSDFPLSVSGGEGTVTVHNGQVVDPMEPSVWTVLNLMHDPPLTHRGRGGFWSGGTLLGFVMALSVLYADDLFRHRVKQVVKDVEEPEPTEWEITSRIISWLMGLIAMAAIYYTGLQQF